MIMGRGYGKSWKEDRQNYDEYEDPEPEVDPQQDLDKWIKEEIEIWESNHKMISNKGKVTDVQYIKRWMDRFNLTEKDLKDE